MSVELLNLSDCLNLAHALFKRLLKRQCCMTTLSTFLLRNQGRKLPDAPGIAKLCKRPSAWAPEHEDEEVGADTKRMRLCPVTACDDMELDEVVPCHCMR